MQHPLSRHRTRVCVYLVAALSIAALFPVEARACSCAMLPHDMAVASYDASFRGRVTSVVRDGDDEVVTFSVVEVFRNVTRQADSISVRRYAGVAPCPIPVFEVGETYRVYANLREGALQVHYCNPSGR